MLYDLLACFAPALFVNRYYQKPVADRLEDAEKKAAGLEKELAVAHQRIESLEAELKETKAAKAAEVLTSMLSTHARSILFCSFYSV